MANKEQAWASNSVQRVPPAVLGHRCTSEDLLSVRMRFLPGPTYISDTYPITVPKSVKRKDSKLQNLKPSSMFLQVGHLEIAQCMLSGSPSARLAQYSAIFRKQQIISYFHGHSWISRMVYVTIELSESYLQYPRVFLHEMKRGISFLSFWPFSFGPLGHLARTFVEAGTRLRLSMAVIRRRPGPRISRFGECRHQIHQTRLKRHIETIRDTTETDLQQTCNNSLPILILPHLLWCV